MTTGLPTRVIGMTRQRCAACGAERVAPETRVIVNGEAYCVPCERAIRAAGQFDLTPEARAFVKRLEARGLLPKETVPIPTTAGAAGAK